MKKKQKDHIENKEYEEDDIITEFETTDDMIDSVKRHKIDQKNERIQWIEKYSPKVSTDICINPRKLRDLRIILGGMIRGESNIRLLVLTGPPGCSKSTSIKVLANELMKQSSSSAVGFDAFFETKSQIEYYNEYIDSTFDGINQSSVFSEFLNDTKFKTNTAILVEDLPNIFHKDTLNNFRKSIQEWILTSSTIKLPPLILCITEIDNYNEDSKYEAYNIENNLTADTLLGRDILDNVAVKTLKFNPIAMSFIKKSISKIISNERIVFSKIPKKEVDTFISSIIEIGDIRSIISNLEYWATLKAKAISSKQNIEMNFKRESKLNLFHATGKIIYSSSKFKHLENEDDQDFNSVQTVIDNFVSNNSNLMRLSLLENYPLYNNMNFDIETASEIADALSIGDTMNYLEEGIDLSVRATRNKLRNVKETTSKQGHLKFPRNFKMNRLRSKSLHEVSNYRIYINELRDSLEDINLIQGYYIPLIYNSFRYKFIHKKQNKIRYNRIGGGFKEVYADDVPEVEEEDINDINNEFNQDQFKIDIRKKIAARQQEEAQNDSSDELSDPIEESDVDSDDIFDDSFDDELNDLMNRHSQKTNIMPTTGQKTNIISTASQKMNLICNKDKKDNDSDEFSSDSELEALISQGKL